MMAGSTIDTPRPHVPPGDPSGPVWADTPLSVLVPDKIERLSGWDTPVPFDDGEAPVFPSEVLPSWLHRWVDEVSEATQTPRDLAGLLGIAAISVASILRYDVMPRPGWHEPLCIFGIVVLEPATRKSAVFSRATKPINAYEKLHRQEMGELAARSETELSILEGRLKSTKAAIQKAKNRLDIEALTEQALSISAEIEKFEVVKRPQITVSDSTPERLATLMAENNGRIGLFSSEGGIFETFAGRYASGVSNIDIMLQGHAGDRLVVERVSRKSTIIDSAKLTMGITIQPSVLRDMAEKPGFMGRGLMGRMIFAIPTDNVGKRNATPRYESDETIAGYAEHLTKMLRDGDKDGQITLYPDDDAIQMHIDYERAIEPKLGPGGEFRSMRSWAGKQPGLAARLAALLHLADGRGHANITAETMSRAIVLTDHYAAHAKLAFGLMATDPTMAGARKILRWLRRQPYRPEFTRRVIHRALIRSFPRAADLDKPLQLLEEMGWLRLAVQKSDSSGGRPSPVCTISPYVWEEGF